MSDTKDKTHTGLNKPKICSKDIHFPNFIPRSKNTLAMPTHHFQYFSKNEICQKSQYYPEYQPTRDELPIKTLLINQNKHTQFWTS